eukprot:1315849-Prymnesium_polylepis.1
MPVSRALETTRSVAVGGSAASARFDSTACTSFALRTAARSTFSSSSSSSRICSVFAGPVPSDAQPSARSQSACSPAALAPTARLP